MIQVFGDFLEQFLFLRGQAVIPFAIDFIQKLIQHPGVRFFLLPGLIRLFLFRRRRAYQRSFFLKKSLKKFRPIPQWR